MKEFKFEKNETETIEFDSLNMISLIAAIEELARDAPLAQDYKSNDRISCQAKMALEILNEGLKTVDEIKDKVTLFIGGIILTLIQDDNNYYKDRRLYPQCDDLKKVLGYYLGNLNIDGNYLTTENYNFLMTIGSAALTNPSLLFPESLFTTEHDLIQGNTPSTFFPAMNLGSISSLMSYIQKETLIKTKLSDNRYSIFNSKTKVDFDSPPVNYNINNSFSYN